MKDYKGYIFFFIIYLLLTVSCKKINLPELKDEIIDYYVNRMDGMVENYQIDSILIYSDSLLSYSEFDSSFYFVGTLIKSLALLELDSCNIALQNISSLKELQNKFKKKDYNDYYLEEYSEYEPFINLTLGLSNCECGDIGEAYIYLASVLEDRDYKDGNYLDYKTLKCLGEIYYSFDDFIRSEYYFIQALHLFNNEEEIEELENDNSWLNHLAIARLKNRRKDRFLSLQKSVNSYFKKNKDYENLLNGYRNLGLLDGDSSYIYLQKSILLAEKIDSKKSLFLSLKDIAVKYFKDDNHDSTKVYFEKALLASENIESLSSETEIKLLQLDFFLTLNEYNNALSILKELLYISPDSLSIESKTELYFLASEYYEQRNTPKKSLEFLKKAYSLQDSTKQRLIDKSYRSIKTGEQLFNLAKEETERIKHAKDIRLSDWRKDSEAQELKYTIQNFFLSFTFFFIATFLSWRLFKSWRKSLRLAPVEEQMNTPKFQSNGSIILKTKKKLPFSDILYIEKKKYEDRVIFYLEGGEIEFDRGSIASLEKSGKLPYPLFAKASQSCIVNVMKVDRTLPGGNIIIKFRIEIKEESNDRTKEVKIKEILIKEKEIEVSRNNKWRKALYHAINSDK